MARQDLYERMLRVLEQWDNQGRRSEGDHLYNRWWVWYHNWCNRQLGN